MATTVTPGTPVSFPIGAFDTITVTASPASVGTVSFTAGALSDLRSDVSAGVCNNIYGPYGVPGTVTISVTSGVVAYTQNYARGSVATTTAATAAATAYQGAGVTLVDEDGAQWVWGGSAYERGAGGGVSVFDDPTVSMIGDSYVANGYATGTGVNILYTRPRGLLPLLNALAGSPLNLIHAAALTGTRSDQWVANGYVTSAIASGAKYVFVGFPVNDCIQSYTYEQITTSMGGIIDSLTAAGCIPILSGGIPTATSTQPQRYTWARVDQWLRQQSINNDWMFVDFRSALQFDETGTLSSGTDASYDSGVHPNAAGMMHVATYNLPEFKRRFVNNWLARYASVTTNHVYNGKMGGDVSGTPTLWSVLNGGSPTVTRTKVARTKGLGTLASIQIVAGAANDFAGIQQNVSLNTAWSTGAKTAGTRILAGGNHYVCTTAGNAGASEPTWNTTIGATTTDGTVVWTRVETISVGDTVQAFMRFRVHSISGGTAVHPRLTVNATGGTNTSWRALDPGGDTTLFWSGLSDEWAVLSTSPIVVEAGVTLFTVQAMAVLGNGVTATLEIDSIVFRKVP